MYNISPEVKRAWHHFFQWISERADAQLTIIDHSLPDPIEDLWSRKDMGCVLMCGWPYFLRTPRPQLIAAAVPSPDRYGDLPIYYSDFIVREESPYKKLEDTFGKRLAWTVERSHSGFNAPRYHLLKYRTKDRPVLYAKTVGPVYTPLGALESVKKAEAEVAPMDSYTRDLMEKHTPDLLHDVRVIATTEAAPFPPLVASSGINPEWCTRLMEVLLNVHRSCEMAPVLKFLLIKRFAPVKPSDYQITEDWAQKAIEAGYPKPA
jgi:ABC-type phosphate/phosphonate transport system substrate-binding protein